MTTMLATLSRLHVEESVSTLRYAERAKLIINKAHINQDENAQMIHDLKSQVKVLKRRVQEYEMERQESQDMAELKQHLVKSETWMKNMIQAYEDKLVRIN